MFFRAHFPRAMKNKTFVYYLNRQFLFINDEKIWRNKKKTIKSLLQTKCKSWSRTSTSIDYHRLSSMHIFNWCRILAQNAAKYKKLPTPRGLVTDDEIRPMEMKRPSKIKKPRHCVKSASLPLKVSRGIRLPGCNPIKVLSWQRDGSQSHSLTKSSYNGTRQSLENVTWELETQVANRILE